ncbi:hypothetical protein G6F46_013504 [Rhizopus delemar]|nr:hypothetical protein G6F46_013504 [Rhizopus delemar]
MTGFICIVTETLPAGLLPQISDGLAVSASLAGQMVTAYALGSLLAAIPLTIATRGWRRRNVLLLTIVGFLVFTSATALSSQYGVTLVARFFAGEAAGLAWSLLAGDGACHGGHTHRLVPGRAAGHLAGIRGGLARGVLDHVRIDVGADRVGAGQGARLPRPVRS